MLYILVTTFKIIDQFEFCLYQVTQILPMKYLPMKYDMKYEIILYIYTYVCNVLIVDEYSQHGEDRKVNVLNM